MVVTKRFIYISIGYYLLALNKVKHIEEPKYKSKENHQSIGKRLKEQTRTTHTHTKKNSGKISNKIAKSHNYEQSL